MRPFYLFLFVLFAGANLIKKKKGEKAMFVFAWFVIVLFCGGIDGSLQGGDITNYYNHVIRAQNLTYTTYTAFSPFEIGYSSYTWVIAHAFSNPQVFMYIHFGIVTFLFLYFIYKNSTDKFIALITYICLGGFMFYLTAFRQAIACAFCLYGVVKLQNNKPIRAVLCFLLATLFHKTAVVFLPLVLIRKFSVNRKNVILFVVAFIVATLSLDRIVGFANEAFGKEYGNRSEAVFGAVINITMFMVLFYFLYEKGKKDIWLRNYMVDNGFGLIIIMTILSGSVYSMRFYTQAIERVAFYFFPSICGTWSYVLDRNTNHDYCHVNPQYRLIFEIAAVGLIIFRFHHTFGQVYLIY